MAATVATTDKKPRRRLPAAERRTRILQAALELFAERGYQEASMVEIARAAGITPAVIYDHFESKADLHITLLERQTDDLLAFVGSAVAAAPEDRAIRMRDGVDAFFRFFEDNSAAWRVLFRDPPTDPAILAAYEGIHGRATGGIAMFLTDNAPEGLFDEPGAELRAEMLAQMLKTAQNGLADWWYDHRDVPREEIVDAVLDFCWLGFERVAAGESSQRRRPRRR